MKAICVHIQICLPIEKWIGGKWAWIYNIQMPVNRRSLYLIYSELRSYALSPARFKYLNRINAKSWCEKIMANLVEAKIWKNKKLIRALQLIITMDSKKCISFLFARAHALSADCVIIIRA